MTRLRYINIFSAIALVAAATSCSVDEINPAKIEEPGNAVSLVCAVSQPRVNLSTKDVVNYKGILESTTTIPNDKDIEVGLVRVDRTRIDFLKFAEAPAYGLSFKAGMKGLDDADPDADYSTQPHYYFTKGEMEGGHTAGYRKIKNFHNAQFFKTNTDVVNYISWYPFGEVNGNAGAGHENDPFTITEPLDLKTDVIYSDIARESMNKEYKDTLVYHHALCQFRIYVYRMINLKEVHKEGHEVELVDDNIWGKLKDIIVKNECESMTIQLPNTLTYDYSADQSFTLSESLPNASITNGTYNYPEGSNGVFYVKDEEMIGDEHPDVEGVILPTGLENRKLVATYLAPPPEDGLLQLDVEASSAESEKTITIANEFKAGFAYNVVLCFSDHGVINAEVSIEKWDNAVKIEADVEAEMYYDLSRYGTANSYIVSSANLGYSFNGITKGCGNTLNGGTIVGMDDCSLPSDSYVELLYCEPEGLLQLKSNKLIDRSILFYVPGYEEAENPHPGSPDYRLKTKGNAIIAVRRAQGAEILWSWHIWVTDRPRDIGNNNGYSIMDRNLGALVGPKNMAEIEAARAGVTGTAEDVKYFGYYYQWGRKDPMIPGVTTLLTTTATMAESVKNPDKFYGYTYPTQGYEWHTEEAGVEKTALWGYRPNRDYVKTIYDPCPPGYRVPELKAWTQHSGTQFKTFQVPGEKDAFYINGLYTWYPASGWIDADDQPQGTYISISHRTGPKWYGGPDWEAEKEGTDNFACTANVMNYTDASSVTHYGVGNVFNASDVAGDGRPNSADACPVRCISTASETIVRNLSKAQTSNCYIIPEGGTYMFKADVKGNATAKVTTSGGTFDVYDSSVNIDHDQINHVAVLWWQGDLSGQTGTNSNSAGTKCPIKFVRTDGDVLPANPARNGTDFKDEDLAVVDANGYVRFMIDDDQYCHGNAILAAFDKNNNVLWSWHMWLTDTPQKVKFGPRTVDSHTYTYYCMDRNLGATYCPTETEITGKNFGADGAAKRLGTIGFYYQWGRKDPIQGPPGYNTGTGTNSSTWYLRDVNNGYSWTTMNTIRTHASVATRDEHVLYPDYFLYSTATSGRRLWNNTNWGSSGTTYGKYTASWGYPAGTTGATYDPRMTKTVNDPCPPGYYMPPHYFFAAAYLANSGNDSNGISHTYNPDSGDTNGLFATNGGTNGFILGAPMWFPFGGYRAYGSGNLTNVGTNGAYHSGLDWGAENIRVFRLEHTGGGQYQLPPATGATVRCRAY